jgi:hypothetical protein
LGGRLLMREQTARHNWTLIAQIAATVAAGFVPGTDFHDDYVARRSVKMACKIVDEVFEMIERVSEDKA